MGRGSGSVGLADLPSELVHDILARSDQDGRMACLLASKTLMSVARQPRLFEDLTMNEPDTEGAVRFVTFAQPRSLLIKSCSPDDVAMFLDALADAGAHRTLQYLTVEFGDVVRLPCALLRIVGRYPELLSVRISADRVMRECDLAFPLRFEGLSKLQTLCLVEFDEQRDGRNVVLHFSGAQHRLPCLETVFLAVQSSDVLTCGGGSFPSLRRCVYRSDDETYDDLDLVDMTLEHLELDLHSETNADALFGQLASMERADTLVLVSWWDALLFDSPLPCEHLVVQLTEDESCVQFDFVSLRDDNPLLRSVSVSRGTGDGELPSPPPSGSYVLRFVSVPSLSDFLEYRVVRFDAPGACVHIDPL